MLVCEKLESVLAGMGEEDALQMYCQSYDLFYIFEFNVAGLGKNNLVVILSIDKFYFGFSFAVPVCQFAKENDRAVPGGVLGCVYCLDDVDDTRHRGSFIENHPVADNC